MVADNRVAIIGLWTIQAAVTIEFFAEVLASGTKCRHIVQSTRQELPVDIPMLLAISARDNCRLVIWICGQVAIETMKLLARTSMVVVTRVETGVMRYFDARVQLATAVSGAQQQATRCRLEVVE